MYANYRSHKLSACNFYFCQNRFHFQLFMACTHSRHVPQSIQEHSLFSHRLLDVGCWRIPVPTTPPRSKIRGRWTRRSSSVGLRWSETRLHFDFCLQGMRGVGQICKLCFSGAIIQPYSKAFEMSRLDIFT